MAIASKLAEVMHWTLRSGGHEPQQITAGEACVMEAVAYVAGLPLSDSPECACPVISSFLRSWNDGLNEEDRNRLLKPLIPDLVGTKSTEAVEQRRAYMAVDWLIRVHAPAWLDLAGLADHATALRDLEEIADRAGCVAAEGRTSAARSAARSAADSAADSAARSAAYSAARSAARSAADSAARSAAYSAAYSAARSAADSAARSAADSAAYSAAYSAADSAARSALQPTITVLQASALDLVKRMIAVRDA